MNLILDLFIIFLSFNPHVQLFVAVEPLCSIIQQIVRISTFKLIPMVDSQLLIFKLINVPLKFHY